MHHITKECELLVSSRGDRLVFIG